MPEEGNAVLEKNYYPSSANIGKNVTLDKSTLNTDKDSVGIDDVKKSILIGEYTNIGKQGGNIYLGAHVNIGNSVRIEGDWIIEDGAIIEDGCVLEGDGVVEKGARIRKSEITGSAYIGAGAKIIKSTLYEKVRVEDESLVVGSSLGVYSFETEGIKIGKNNKVVNSPIYGTATIGDYNQIRGATLDGTITLGNNNEVKGTLEGILKIGDYNKIKKSATLDGTVTLGDGNKIKGNLEGTLTMGDYNDIKNSATLGSEPQIRNDDGETLESYLEIGSHNRIWGDIQGSPDKEDRTKIGDHCTIMTLTHIAHQCKIHDHAIITTSSNLAGHVKVGRWAVVSGDNKIEQHVEIGPYAFTEGGIKLRKDVLPFFRGNPEENTAVNVIGLRHAHLREAGLTEKEIDEVEEFYESLKENEELMPSMQLKPVIEKYEAAMVYIRPIIEEIENAYHLVFKRRKNNYKSIDDLVAQLRERFQTSELVLELADFIEKASKRRRLHIHSKDLKQNGQTQIEQLENRIKTLERKRWYKPWTWFT